MGIVDQRSTVLDDLIAGPCEPNVKKVVLLAGQGALVRGTILGKIGVGAAAVAAKAGGNTGNGTLTMDVTTPLLVRAKSGIYTVRCIGLLPTAVGTPTKAVKAGGNTGAGDLTLDGTTPRLAGAIPGVYKVRCITATADGGTFRVTAPDGTVIGDVAVGATFDNHIKFVIADGNPDFVVGDGWDITVAEEDIETFRVTNPLGQVLGDLIPGVTFANEIKFALADGSTDFIVGDGWDITVAAGSGKYKKVSASAVDGSQIADCILSENENTGTSPGADVQSVAYKDGKFNRQALVVAEGDTVAAHEEELRAKGIILRDEFYHGMA
jgi:hypothetical protein